ncbi:Diguanylate cyclase/phosphodiesterase [Magnetospirillum gryphiswaldense MSR-1 v2]|uniref:Diguanylate cyclase/phosphodiesterase n=2 Tax=Magnetospirillum gryphiswaldense TaxID=55518 RepID=V6F084_MAGGM|nr:Diguanylate cyclase/phosphodiesterase [Magnetospirillum gryphiswaldense MSR-1 v2]
MDGGEIMTEGTGRKEKAKAISNQYRSLFENAVEGIYRTTPSGRYLNANQALARIYGYDSPKALIEGLTDIAHGLYVHPEDRDRFKRLLDHESVVRNFEAQVYRKTGEIIWIAENARLVRDDDGNAVCYEGTVQDITERKLTEERLRLAATVYENVGEAIIVTDTDDVVHAINPAFSRMTGFAVDQVVGLKSKFIADEINDPKTVAEAWDFARRGETWHGELWGRRSNGDVFPASVALTGVQGENGEVGSFVMVASDVTRRKMDEQRIRFHARHDALTKLANRHTVMEALGDAIVRAENEGNRLALLFLDVNHFKDVNDSFGHAAGDELLKQVARRLKGCVRASDIIGRLGGDEFVVALPSITDAQGALACVEKVLYAFSEPFSLPEQELYASTSIGVALYPDHADCAETLLSHADAAMYHAKAGGNAYRFYDSDMDRQAAERVNLENDLRHALAEGQFRLNYQPKIDGISRKVVAAEALIRWKHPTRGNVSPALFIPVAERAGLIGAIGDWALAEACRQMRLWLDDGIEFGCISVNLSPAQFHDASLKQKVERSLSQWGLSPSLLELEITETMMATEVDRAIAIVGELGQMGVRMSIDDFGTGYSSLAYLKLFPVNVLKIDRAFIKELPGNRKDGAIVSSIATLAANLGFEVIAEGVETQAQAGFLLTKGVTLMQGFLFSPAVPPDEFAQLVRTGV